MEQEENAGLRKYFGWEWGEFWGNTKKKSWGVATGLKVAQVPGDVSMPVKEIQPKEIKYLPQWDWEKFHKDPQLGRQLTY